MLTPRHISRFLAVLVLLAAAWTFPGRTSRGASRRSCSACRSHQGQARRSQGNLSSEDRGSQERGPGLARREDQGRSKKKHNKDRVDMLASQKADFQKDSNKLPASLGKSREFYAKRIGALRRDLDKAYGLAISGYTAAGKDAQADAIKSERDDSRLKNAAILPYRRKPGGPGRAAGGPSPAQDRPQSSHLLLLEFLDHRPDDPERRVQDYRRPDPPWRHRSTCRRHRTRCGWPTPLELPEPSKDPVRRGRRRQGRTRPMARRTGRQLRLVEVQAEPTMTLRRPSSWADLADKMHPACRSQR